MTKGFVTNLTKLGKKYNGSIMVDGGYDIHNAVGSISTIHDAVRSHNNVPTIQHNVLQVPAPNHCCRNNIRSLSKSRKKTIGSPRSNEQKSVLSPRQNLGGSLRSSCTCHSCQSTGIHNASYSYPSERCHYPVLLSSSFLNIEKTNSCPVRTCACISKASQSTSKLKRSSIKSQSTVEVSNSIPNSQIAQHIICTDEVVTELKDEIERVKNRLHHITLCKIEKNEECLCVDRNDTRKIISQLRTENCHLRKQLDEKNRSNDLEKARDIMNTYERKVVVLHEQAIKSSKLMKQSKERFCKCLRNKEDIIKELRNSNDGLQLRIKEKEMKYDELNKIYESLQDMFEENHDRCDALAQNNQKFCKCIKTLETQLQNSITESEEYKERLKELQLQITNMKCENCQKIEMKTTRQKAKFENKLKEHENIESDLNKQISILSSKIKDAEIDKLAVEKLEAKYNVLQDTLVEYEKCASKCKFLEEECKRHCEKTLQNEKEFEHERNEMKQLVDELTTVVKENKVTLLKLSDINKQHEALIVSQSAVLLEKEENIRLVESTIEMMKKQSSELEREVEDLRKTLSGPCRNETCSSLSKQLEEMRSALSLEKDNQRLKEKIIEDQSQTICCLQYQIKEKMSELSKAREDTNIAEAEMVKINDDLLKKHKDLERELDEKQHLHRKLQKLEYQKSYLSTEMQELEKLLQQYRISQQCDEKQYAAVSNLQKQVERQRRDWEGQKRSLAQEKEKAVQAAKFATHKLLDTVADFQKQVDTQKKVQNMLTRMLHNKEEELEVIKSKMFSINSITSRVECDISTKELYKRNQEFNLSNPTTGSSCYSSGSSCMRNIVGKPNNENYDLQRLFILIKSDEEPIKDIQA